MRIGPARAHPLGDDAPQVAVDHDERLDLERRRDLEDRPQGRALATDAIDLGVGDRDPVELVGRADQEDRFHVVGRLGLDDDALGPVGAAGIRVDEDGLELREVLDEPGVRGPDDVPDRRRVLEARDADHDAGSPEPGISSRMAGVNVVGGTFPPYHRRPGRERGGAATHHLPGPSTWATPTDRRVSPRTVET